MRTFFMATVAACAILGLSSCATSGSSLPNLPGVTNPVLVDEKALYVAEAAYSGLATLAEAAVDSGALTGERAAQVRELNRQAYVALQKARSGQQVADQTAIVFDLVARAQAIIHRRE